MEPDNAEFRETFVPFSFKPIEVRFEGKPLFAGTMLGVEPEASANSRTVTVSAYALPAVLGDCTMAAADLPLEFGGLRLREIISVIAGRFELETDIREDLGDRIKKVAIDVDRTPLEFLIELLKQRNAVLSDTPTGQLLCWRSTPAGSPIARWDANSSPTVKASFNAQEYYSEITGFTPAKRRKRGSHFTERNPFLNTIKRPLSFRLDDSEAGDAPGAVKAKLGRMFANMASYTIEDIPSLKSPDGNLWESNKTVKITAPTAMIYRETELLIRSVTLKRTKDADTASLNLVLPGAFSGEIPTTLPWS